MQCPTCESALTAVDPACLPDMRNKATTASSEPEALYCSACNESFTCSDRISAAFSAGYRRVFNRDQPSDEDRLELVWDGLGPEPSRLQPDGSPTENYEIVHDKWLLNVAFIQNATNIHDWRHRNSCFKGKKKLCRYKIPQRAYSRSCVSAVFAKIIEPNGMRLETTDIVGLDIDLKKAAAFCFLTDTCKDLIALFQCNSCVKYVTDQKVSFYFGAYIHDGTFPVDASNLGLANSLPLSKAVQDGTSTFL